MLGPALACAPAGSLCGLVYFRMRRGAPSICLPAGSGWLVPVGPVIARIAAVALLFAFMARLGALALLSGFAGFLAARDHPAPGAQQLARDGISRKAV